MAERTFIPSSPACGQWETLLAEALDGLLKPADETTFSAHMAACPACAALFEEARRGREWLEFLSPDPEVPSGLLDKILARTGPGQTADLSLATAGGGHVVPMLPAWQRPGFMGFIRRFAEPRLMMTAAMAFFSIAMTISMTGIRLNSLRISELRPSSVLSLPSVARSFVERRLNTASTPIVRYYDHSRLAYEVQTRMRVLRKSTQGAAKPVEPAPGESKTAPAQQQPALPAQPQQQLARPTVRPAPDDLMFEETALKLENHPAHSGGSRMEMQMRSTLWTA